MKKGREFLAELYSNHIEEVPFLVHFQNNKSLRNKLFDEYLQTEKKPNFSLYLSSHFGKNELDKGFNEIQNNIPVSESKTAIAGFHKNTEFENKISGLKTQFYNLVEKQELSEKFFNHSIIETNVIQKLKLVKQEIKDFEQFVFNTAFYSPNDYATSFAKNLIDRLESIGIPKLRNKILKDFTSEQININLETELFLDKIASQLLSEKVIISKEEAERKYRELKRYADVYINTYLNNNSTKENELMTKYKSIGFLDFKKVNTALSKINSISEKLDYLKVIKKQYYDKYENTKASLNEADYMYYVNNTETFWQVVFGNHSLYSPLSIQKPIYNKYFSDGLKTPEFTYWFLKYDADNLFNHTINSQEFKNKVSSELRETFIKSELKQLEEQEQEAKELLLNKKLDIYNSHHNNSNYHNEVTLLRILDGNYYKSNCTLSLGGWSTTEVQAYYKHILLKPYLEKQLKKQGIKIDKDFIDSLRLNWGTTIWDFNQSENNDSIVPKELTHEYLYRNFILNDYIRKFYFSINTSELISDAEYDNIVKRGYIGTKETFAMPYSFIIYGAYFCRKDLIYKLLSLEYDREIELKGNKIEYFHDLIPYFKDYASGFKIGFDQFENNCVKPFLPMFQDKNDYVYKVFEYLTKHIIFDHSWKNNHGGFTLNGLKEYEIINAFENGQKQGYFYRAWSIVFSNNNLFSNLFEEYYNNKTTNSKHKETLKTKEILTEIKPTFKTEIIETVFDFLKDHFDSTQRNELKKILETGSIATDKLYFKNNGNKLADCFKKLIEVNFITNCTKIELQKWILENFTFKNSKTKQEQNFKLKTLEDVISNKDGKAPCKNPLFNIENGNITKV